MPYFSCSRERTVRWFLNNTKVSTCESRVFDGYHCFGEDDKFRGQVSADDLWFNTSLTSPSPSVPPGTKVRIDYSTDYFLDVDTRQVCKFPRSPDCKVLDRSRIMCKADKVFRTVQCLLGDSDTASNKTLSEYNKLWKYPDCRSNRQCTCYLDITTSGYRRFFVDMVQSADSGRIEILSRIEIPARKFVPRIEELEEESDNKKITKKITKKIRTTTETSVTNTLTSPTKENAEFTDDELLSPALQSKNEGIYSSTQTTTTASQTDVLSTAGYIQSNTGKIGAVSLTSEESGVNNLTIILIAISCCAVVAFTVVLLVKFCAKGKISSPDDHYSKVHLTVDHHRLASENRFVSCT